MTENAFLHEIRESLAPLSHTQKLLFGLAVAERMLPAYRVFSEAFDFGNSKILEKAIQDIKEGKISENQSAKFNQICPDMDDFSSNLLATAAIDAVAVVYELCEMQQDQNPEHLDHIISAIFNIPYMYVDDFSETPYSDPMILAELTLLKTWILKIQAQESIEIPENEWVKRIRLVA
ncbi:MAG: DUF416 family protein [Bacteroidetes bacterium]|nr:MAG: DUF416 family protein [Bacteroidota bacterium]